MRKVRLASLLVGVAVAAAWACSVAVAQSAPGSLPSWSSITVVGSASANPSAGASRVTVPLPAGTQPEDLALVAITATRGAAPQITPPAGYAKVNTFTDGSNADVAEIVYERILQAGDSAVRFSFSAAFAKAVTVAVYRGVNPAQPIDAIASGGTAVGATGTSVTVRSVTTTFPGDHLVAVLGATAGGKNAFTSPTGFTTLASSAVFGAASTIADDALSGAGPTAPYTATFPRPASLRGVAIALEPAELPVTVSGRAVMYDGSRYEFTGMDSYGLNTRWGVNESCGTDPTAIGGLSEIFAALPPNSVVRVWFYQRLALDVHGGPTAPLDFSAMDQLVSMAAHYGDRLIATLGDQWGSCDQGNIYDSSDAEYDTPCNTAYPNVSWYKTLDWYQSEAAGNETTLCGYEDTYLQWVKAVVTHFSTDLNGDSYHNPTIAFWEPMNEAEACTTTSGNGCGSCQESYATPALVNFFTTVGDDIHAIDARALVSNGLLGGDQCGIAGTDYQTVAAAPGVDVTSVHDYGQPAVPEPIWVSDDVTAAAAVTKPLIVGEAGIPAYGSSEPAGAPCVSLTDRVTDFQNKMNADFAAGVSGFLAWSWEQNSGVNSCAGYDYDITPSDPFIAFLDGYVPPPPS
jgi:hypothetical protein